jgi:hypothetical protein
MEERKPPTFGIGVFIYGHSLDENGCIKASTQRRVRKAVDFAATQNLPVVIVGAAGFSPDVPTQAVPMHRQIAEYAIALGASHVCEAPAVTFDTEGEQDSFISLQFVYEVHVSSWWHLVRIKLERRRRPRAPYVEQITYLPVWDIPSPRSGAWECIKLASFLLPRLWREKARRVIKSRVRTSW